MIEKKIDRKGYVRIKIDGRWVPEHRYVYENHLGHGIPAGYLIHHLDENPKNNSLSNLILVTPYEHGRLHTTKKKDTIRCLMCDKEFRIKSFATGHIRMTCSSRCWGRLSSVKRYLLNYTDHPRKCRSCGEPVL